MSDVIPFIVNTYIYTQGEGRKMPSIHMYLCWSPSEKRNGICYLNGDNVEISEMFYFAGARESSRAGRVGETLMAVLKLRAWGIWVCKGRTVRLVHTLRARSCSCRMGALQ